MNMFFDTFSIYFVSGIDVNDKRVQLDFVISSQKVETAQNCAIECIPSFIQFVNEIDFILFQLSIHFRGIAEGKATVVAFAHPPPLFLFTLCVLIWWFIFRPFVAV